MSRYEVRLVGGTAQLGEIAAVDVARLIIAVQTAIARAAGVAIGRPPKATGRWEGTIEEATKLRLVGIERGSVVLQLEPPTAEPSAGQLDLPVDSLADLGWGVATRALSDINSGGADPDVLTRLLRVADEMAIGTRFDAVEFRTDGERVAHLDQQARASLRSAVQRRRESPAVAPGVAGVLYEADFERHTAKVRTQEGGAVDLIFEEEQAATIKDALRERAEFQGEVTFDPITSSIRSVRLRRLTRFEQLLLGDDGSSLFWQPIDLASLAEAQGTDLLTSFDQLRDSELSDDEYEQFIETLS